MTVKRPNAEQLRAVAEDLGMSMSDADLASYLTIMQPNFAAYDAVDAIASLLDGPGRRKRRGALTHRTVHQHLL